MKILGIIGIVVLCFIVRSEVFTLVMLLVGGIAFLAKMGGENPHEFF